MRRSRRYLALWLPYFSTDRLHRTSDALADLPLALARKEVNAMRITAVDAAAREKGLYPGMTLADARARVRPLRILEADPDADAVLLEKIADWCDRFSPILTLDGSDGLLLDITGVAHLFGGETGLARDLKRRLHALGFATKIAIAGTALSAHALARYGKGGIVPPGAESEKAAELPVEALEAGGDVTRALRRAGLETLGMLAERPRKPLAARFGSAFTWRLAQILGEGDQPLSPRRPLPVFCAEQRFADPIGLFEDIEAALKTLAQDLCTGLEREDQGGRCFEASFFRADGTVRRIELLSGQPLREPATLLRLLLMRLDALADPVDPGFGFDMIRLAAVAGDSAPPAQALLDGSEADGQAVEDLVNRLAARFGVEAVQRFVPQDSHMPEYAAKAWPAISERAGSGSWYRGEADDPPLRPLFLFSPPQRIEALAEVPEGPPEHFFWRRVRHTVVRVEGPERIAPEWWKSYETRNTRDYFRIEDQTGQRFWVYRDGLYDRDPAPIHWYIHGIFA
ncbi:Y-family DNA polymerase [Pelagibacterium xiamenense]|uniref:Y-family DNA polymerase n=1 Tax=Pelagibacterium xiamenense TaxID=2901140 RepID=UPI001E5AF6FD|nr:DNA polymerase Y family protein [Pelagibacterium xiamenense]MCD7059654.1 DNA polymerase Y family protein [Pelagibacterium xiamenense]